MLNYRSFVSSIYSLRTYLILSASAFTLSVLLGIYLSPVIGRSVLEELRQVVTPVIGVGPLGMFAFVFVNNSVKALIAVFSGALFGIPTVVFIAVNGVAVGSLASISVKELGYYATLAGILPHGILELPAILLATAMGLSLGKEAFLWLLRGESRIRRRSDEALRIYAAIIMPMLMVAAIIEVTVTPWLMSL